VEGNARRPSYGYTKGKSAVSEQEGNAGLDGSGSGVEQELKVYVQTSSALPKLQD
jgi:hypothetical protein